MGCDYCDSIRGSHDSIACISHDCHMIINRSWTGESDYFNETTFIN